MSGQSGRHSLTSTRTERGSRQKSTQVGSAADHIQPYRPARRVEQDRAAVLRGVDLLGEGVVLLPGRSFRRVRLQLRGQLRGTGRGLKLVVLLGRGQHVGRTTSVNSAADMASW
jgi:hypothetical protein